jgi:DNA-directed RNA polymerase subunit RPC12/RpoP
MKLGIFTDEKLEPGRYRCVECKAEVVLAEREETPVCTVCGKSVWEPVDEGRRFQPVTDTA